MTRKTWRNIKRNCTIVKKMESGNRGNKKGNVIPANGEKKENSETRLTRLNGG